MKVCDRCGVALTPAHGGPAQRLMVVWASGAATTVDLCRGCYEPAVHITLEAILKPPGRSAA